MLQNEMKSDVARFTTHIKPVLQQIRLLTGLNEGGKTRNIVIQLVLQQYRTLSIACTLYKLHSTYAKNWRLQIFNIKFSKCGAVAQLQVPVLMPYVSSEFVVGSHPCFERFSFSALISPFLKDQQ